MDSLGDDGRRPVRNTWSTRFAVPLAALVLLIAGAVLAATGSGKESFGWVAYAPLSSQAFVSGGIFFLSAQTKAGLVLAGIGLLALTFWSGYLLGRRRT
ncbi:hypothetical protein ACFVWT_00245 [Arthrobacter sp. NPDC058288]|uniref:hypothetical protein n=1 Tax=Arthrobacter sp. NPDC058288 TaxID=3346424 RepID=UPI0036EE5803